MALGQRERLVFGQAASMLFLVVVLTLVDRFGFVAFFLGSFIAFLVLAELTAPVTVRPRWRSRLGRVVLAGIAIFVLVVLERAVSLLA